MSEGCDLERIKRWLEVDRQPKPYPATRTGTTILPDEWIDFLIAEVERRGGLLARLEWAGTHCERDREMAACPVCDVLADSEVVGQLPHEPDCWLAAELRKPSAPPQPEG